MLEDEEEVNKNEDNVQRNVLPVNRPSTSKHKPYSRRLKEYLTWHIFLIS
jgi:hypothetical protein